MNDNINPDHYRRLPVEAIEIIESAIQGAPRVESAYLHGQALKYVLRCWAKNGYEDLQKAKWYLDRLVESAKQSDLQSLKDYPFGEPSDPPKPVFAVGDRVRVCKPGAGLDGREGFVCEFGQGEYCIRVDLRSSKLWFTPSELQPAEVAE